MKGVEPNVGGMQAHHRALREPEHVLIHQRGAHLRAQLAQPQLGVSAEAGAEGPCSGWIVRRCVDQDSPSCEGRHGSRP